MLSWIEINTKNIKNNIKELKKQLHLKTKFMAVVKGNAYGHGLLEVSQNIKNDVDYLSVYDFNDALILRKNKIKTPILVLGRSFKQEALDAVKHNIEITITTFDVLKEIAGLKKRPQIHFCFDTGIGRDGFNLSDLSEVVKITTKNKIAVKGLYMHFSAADDKNSDDYSKKQVDNFLKIKKAFADINIKPLCYISASGGVMMKNFGYDFDMVRSGISLYGMWPSDDVYERFKNKIKLKPALSFKTKIVEIKSMPKGSFIAYNRTCQLQRDSKIAILPVGYFDGILRNASNKAQVLIKGKRCNQLGRVMMNMLIIDVTEIKNIKAGNIATIIGNDGKETITAEEWANWAQTINYEITTKLSAFLPRIVK